MPVTGALVQLELADLARHVLTNSEGIFKIASTGVLRVRVDMIGYETWLSEELRVGPQDTVRIKVQLEVQAITLAGIAVETPRRCGEISLASSPLTDALWRNVRTALATARATGEDEPVDFLVERYERQLTLDSLVVLVEDRRRGTSKALEGFRSVPVAQLESSGFVAQREGRIELLGPTGEVILHPWFANTHCMRVLASHAHPGLVGIWFGPNEVRRVPEIRGVMWLDSASLDLRRIEFEYVNLSSALPAASHSGEQEFRRLENGNVILQRWAIRSPLLDRLNRTSVRITGVQESGGEVLRAHWGTSVIFEAERAIIEGIVRNSDGSTVSDARVALNGTPFETRTDSAGFFRLVGLPAGTYQLEAGREAGTAPRRIMVRVTPRQHLRLEIVVLE